MEEAFELRSNGQPRAAVPTWASPKTATYGVIPLVVKSVGALLH